MKRLFLFLGLVCLSALSKVLQAGFQSIWGDILILPAATMFVLAILLYWTRYLDYLKNSRTKNKPRHLPCLAVLSFQLFTILSFGQKMSIGYIFIFPLLVFISLSVYFWFTLSKEKL